MANIIWKNEKMFCRIVGSKTQNNKNNNNNNKNKNKNKDDNNNNNNNSNIIQNGGQTPHSHCRTQMHTVTMEATRPWHPLQFQMHCRMTSPMTDSSLATRYLSNPASGFLFCRKHGTHPFCFEKSVSKHLPVTWNFLDDLMVYMQRKR